MIAQNYVKYNAGFYEKRMVKLSKNFEGFRAGLCRKATIDAELRRKSKEFFVDTKAQT